MRLSRLARICAVFGVCLTVADVGQPAVAAELHWPSFLPAILTGRLYRLPPGDVVYPTSGSVLARYDREQSSDWVAIVGTELGGRPALPVSRIEGLVKGYPFAAYYRDDILTRLDYDRWRLDLRYDAGGNMLFTLTDTGLLASKAGKAAAKATVDCSRTKASYEQELFDVGSVITMMVEAIFYKLAREASAGQDGEYIMAIVVNYLNSFKGFREKLARYAELEQLLAEYDQTCTSGSVETCANGPQTAIWQGRTWQRCDDGHKYNWADAADYCENLNLGGYTDWRLPVKDELKGMVVCSNGHPTPLQDPPLSGYVSEEDWARSTCCFSNTDCDFRKPTIDVGFEGGAYLYWSATTHDADTAWTVFFENGMAYPYAKSTTYAVRCVR